MERFAILKPDHLGDFVISLPAIEKILSQYDADVLVNARVAPIAKQLLPDANILETEFVHLNKPNKDSVSVGGDKHPNLSNYDLVIGLRVDQILDARWYRIYSRNSIIAPSGDVHESQSHQIAIKSLVGGYDVLEAFSQTQARIARMLNERFDPSDNPENSPTCNYTVGFSIGSGFLGNSWSAANWVELGVGLIESGFELRIFGGAKESALSDFISSSVTARTGKDVTVVSGGHDVLEFLNEVRKCKVVVASDGGTAHLCSLVAPIISIFGGSPYQRFRPLGQRNLVATKDYGCSPCVQYFQTIVNGCVGKECIETIKPAVLANLVSNFQSFAGCNFSINGVSIKSW